MERGGERGGKGMGRGEGERGMERSEIEIKYWVIRGKYCNPNPAHSLPGYQDHIG